MGKIDWKKVKEEMVERHLGLIKEERALVEEIVEKYHK